MNSLGIFVKYPAPGAVKTRLGQSIGEEPAAGLYAAFLHDIIAAIRPLTCRKTLCFTPDDLTSRDYFQTLGGPDFELRPQPEADLGDRLSAFFQAEFSQGRESVVVIGSDSPSLSVGWIQRSFAALETVDSVVGPAMDGGYYLLGLRPPLPDCFQGIEWSTPQVFSQTMTRLRAAGRRPHVLPLWYDVDTLEELRFLVDQLTRTREAGAGQSLPETEKWLEEFLPE